MYDSRSRVVGALNVAEALVGLVLDSLTKGNPGWMEFRVFLFLDLLVNWLTMTSWACP